MGNVIIRPAEPDDLPAVAALRWRWTQENAGCAASSSASDRRTARAEFIDHFVAWARENSAAHRCLVVVRGEDVLGMAWLAVVQRVPTPQTPVRRSGDVQCVYVAPELRDNGVGGRLIDAIVALAAELGLERVTVHSSFRAISAYCRGGFAASPRLLQARPGTADSGHGSATG